MEDTPKPDMKVRNVMFWTYTQAYKEKQHYTHFWTHPTNLKTHINPFDSVWKLQSLVESVDVDFVGGVFV